MSWLSVITKPFLRKYFIGSVYTTSSTPACIPPAPDLRFGLLEDLGEIESLRNPVLKDYWGKSAEGTWVFGAWHRDRLAAFCCFTAGETYRNRPNGWGLGPGEAELTEVATFPEFRGQGVAPRLIVHGLSQMQRHGFERFFARIWHSNRASMAAFGKAGWVRCAWFLELTPRFPARRFRLMWPARNGTGSRHAPQ